VVEKVLACLLHDCVRERRQRKIRLAGCNRGTGLRDPAEFLFFFFLMISFVYSLVCLAACFWGKDDGGKEGSWKISKHVSKLDFDIKQFPKIANIKILFLKMRKEEEGLL
jgi:hypothetical protein